MSLHCIYKHTFPNGKVYIGQTISGRTENRWNGGFGYKNAKKVFAAIIKYGWDNICHEVIEDGLTDNQVDSHEAMWIFKYNSIKNGYNSVCPTAGAKPLNAYWMRHWKICMAVFQEKGFSDFYEVMSANGFFPEDEYERLLSARTDWFSFVSKSFMTAAAQLERPLHENELWLNTIESFFRHSKKNPTEETAEIIDVFYEHIISYFRVWRHEDNRNVWRLRDGLRADLNYKLYEIAERRNYEKQNDQSAD